MAISRTLLANNAARTTTLERNRQVSHLRSLPRLVWTGVLLWAAVSGIGTNLLADDDPATSTTPATPATSADAEEATSPRTVYLPYRNLAEVLKEHGATAIVPYEDYLRMIDESQQKPGPAVPVDAVITKATYRGAVAGDVARITATYHITVLGNPWIELPLDFGNAAIGKVSAADKKQVMLRGMGAGKYGLLIGEAGDVQVTFELVTPIKTSPDGREFALSIPSVGISTIEFSVPEKDQSVRILEAIVQSAAPPKATEVAEGDAANGDSPVKPADAVDDADETRVLATLGGSRTISARWHPKSGMKPEMDLLSSVVNRQQISIEDGLIHRDAWLTFQILRGSTNSLEFSVPTGQRILDVSADARVKSWKATDEQGRQLVLVELLTPADKEVTLEVHTEETLPAGPFFLGGISETGFVRGIHAVGAVRENGQVAVSVSNDLMLTIVDQQGVSRIDNGTADNRLRGEGRQTWKYYTPQFQLSATVAQIQPRVVVEQASRLTFTPDELQLVANLDFTVERAGLFDVKLRLPSQFSVDDVQCDAMQERSINPAGDLLSIRLKEKTLGQFRIIVQGHRTLAMAENDVEQDLPLLEPLNVERETGTIHVYAPAAIEVATNEKELQAVQPAPSPPGLRNGEALLTSAWTYSRRPVRIPVKTTRKPTRLSVQIATVVDVQPEVIEVTTHLDALVEFAGIDTFQFLVPADVSDRVQIDVPANDNTSSPIKQKSAAPAEKGWVLWTVETQREVLGRQRFQIVYRLTDDAPVHATPVAVGTTPPTPIPATPTPVDSLVPDPTLPTPATPDTTTPEPTPTPASADSSGTPLAPPVAGTKSPDDRTEIASATSAAAGRPKSRTILLIKPTGVAERPARPAVPLTQLSGEIRIDKERSLSLQGEASGGDVEPIDIRELTLVPSQGAIAYRYYRQPDEGGVELQLVASRFDVQEVIPTIVRKGLIEIATSRHTAATYRCRFLVKSVERQRLRIDLPRGMELLGAFVGSREVKPNQVQDPATSDSLMIPYDINIDRATPSDEEFLLTVQFNWAVTPQPYEAMYGRGKLALPIPRIGGSQAPALVQELRTIVYAPEGFWLVGTPDKFRVEGARPWHHGLFESPVAYIPSSLDRWIEGGNVSGLQLPVDNLTLTAYSNLGGAESIQIVWWDRLKISLVFSIALAIVGFLLLSTGWENKLSLLLVLVFAASLLGLADLPALTHGLAAARYGLLFLLGLWLVHGLFQLRPASPIGGDIILPQETIVSLPTEETPTPVASTPEAATAAPSDGIASEAKPTSPDEPPPDKS